MYRVDLITPPTELPVSLEGAKAHARVLNVVEDPLLQAWLTSVTERVQEVTDRQCLEATHEVILDTFEDPDRPAPLRFGRIELRPAPLVEVLSVKYIDIGGVEQTMAITDYTVSKPSGPTCEAGAVLLAPSVSWPSLQMNRLEAVRIRFKAGYGSAAAAVPQGLKDAIHAGVAELFQYRERPNLTDALAPHLEEFRLWR